MKLISLNVLYILFCFSFDQIYCSLIWCGGITTNSAVVVVENKFEGDVFAIATSVDDLIENPIFSASLIGISTHKLQLTELIPNTKYFYGIQGDQTLTGKFTTFAEGAMSFDIAFASCSNHGDNPEVFKEISERNLSFFVHMGDLHYRDIDVNDNNLFAEGYRGVHEESNQVLLYHSTPVVYIWDDHDYGPNNSDANDAGKVAARLMYQRFVPHYPLVAGEGNVPIYQSFTVGRIRFILTDLRSEANDVSTETYPGIEGTSMMSKDQIEWFESELKNATDYKMLVWVTSKPFNGIDTEPKAGKDRNSWTDFHSNRKIIANMIATYKVDNLIAISGDAHLLAIDDGTHNDFSDDGGWGFPIFQAAPMSRSGSVKGGPYNQGCASWDYWASSNYGFMSIKDEGDDDVCFKWEAYQFDQGPLNKVFDYEACAPFNKAGFPSDVSKKQEQVCSIPIAPPTVIGIVSTSLALIVTLAAYLTISCCGGVSAITDAFKKLKKKK